MNQNMRKIIAGVIVILFVSSMILGLNHKDGRTVEIVLRTNGGVPYKWEYVIEDDTIIKCKKVRTESKDSNIDGGIIYQYYSFEGLKEGTTTILFEYKDILEQSVNERKKYNVSVDEHMKLIMTEVQ